MIRVERRDEVSIITVDRPERKGALNRALRLEMGELVEREALDPEVGGIVIAGTEGNFCAGGDVTEMGTGAHTLSSARALVQRSSQRIVRALYKADKPVVAAVDGAAAGFGWSIALSADHLVASPRARFSIAFSRIGLIPDGAAIFLLRERIGPHATMQLVSRATSLTLEDARSMGLVDEVHDGPDIVSHAVSVVRSFNAPSALAFSITKQLVRLSTSTLEDFLYAELLSVPQGMVSEEHKTAANALRARLGKGLA
ncbi:hypothetical protein HKCCE2091_03670 [Rhodobacterales bacterium HKCCE2091]|nr:hypothetical protein [Rhodobacterales bacterium HKCCE2091]